MDYDGDIYATRSTLLCHDDDDGRLGPMSIDRTAEEPQDVIARLTPEQREVVQAYRSAVARRAGRAGRGAAKARTKEQCQKAQKAAMATREAKKAAMELERLKREAEAARECRSLPPSLPVEAF